MTGKTMCFGAYVFDAYGTLFDVHSAVRRHAAALGPDAAAFSDLWRTKQLEYSWVRSLAGHYRDFDMLTEDPSTSALRGFRRLIAVSSQTFSKPTDASTVFRKCLRC